MGNDKIHLLIVSPERTVFDGNVQYVKLPGTLGLFGVYDRHAPLISSLQKGNVIFRNAEGKTQFAIERGFVEVKDNTVSVCVTETKS